MGFLTLLFSGTTLLSFKYYLLNDKVKKLKRLSIPEGNNFINLYKMYINYEKLYKNKIGTSETLCNETEKLGDIYSKIKLISVHVPTHLKPANDNQFGHYLAGLIDGDGHFSKQQQLVIVFNSLDVSLAYYIKKQIGFGNMRKVKNKKKIDTLILIKNFLGGNIGYRKNQDTYYYGSTSFGSAKNVVDYFNSFHLLSSKYISYLK